jgi:heavy metal sensor kinase
LTLSYLVVFATLLALYVGGTAVILYWQLWNQLGRFAIEDVETVEGLLYFGPDSKVHMNEDYHNHPDSRLVLERLLEVLSPEGKVLYRNERLGNLDLGGMPFSGEGVQGYSLRAGRLANGVTVLLVSRRHVLEGHPIIIRLAYSQDSIWSRIREVLTASATALPLLLAIAGFLGYQLVRKSLLPLEGMAAQAEKINAEQLHQRLPVTNPSDELGSLATTFNKVLDRLEQSFEQLRRFTSDASHELRTPLAAIRSVGEVGLQRGRNAAEYQETIGSMLEEVGRLTRLVESLLTISRADARQIQPNFAVFELGEMVREVTSLIEALAEEKRQRLVLALDSEIDVHADRLLLRQAILNVLHNAVKNSPQGGAISVRISHDSSQAKISITDSGPGIPLEHRQKVFDRFYRMDLARTRDTGGAGLGLSIAKWAVQVQGGDIRIEDGGEGATFSIELPLLHNNTPVAV